MNTALTDHLYVVPENPLPTEHVRTKPAFGYYGAKQRIATPIISSLPPHNAWVEAFCGSAAVTLAKPPAPIEIINDLDDNVVNVFQQLRNNFDALYRAIELTPYARSEFQHARSAKDVTDPLERARIFLVANMMTVNSTTAHKGSCGFSFSQSYVRGGMEARVSRWRNLPDRLRSVVERLRTVRIENRDARDLVRMFSNRPATLLYLDPPYFVERAYDYAVDAKDAKFHRELLRICCSSRAMIIISGYRNPLYDSILTKRAGWSRKIITTQTRDTTGADYARSEVLWRNKQFTQAANSGRIPLRLTRQEIDENKLNPPRSR